MPAPTTNTDERFTFANRSGGVPYRACDPLIEPRGAGELSVPASHPGRLPRPRAATGERYDVIVVGARCAGSPTAMLLARAGLQVLVIDRAAFPSDTISGHAIKPPGVAYLQRWGLLGDVLATNCPPIRGRHVQFGQRVLDLPSPPPGGLPPLAPRRVVLDALLLDAARAAGAEVRERASLQDVIWGNNRVTGAHVRDRDGHLRVVRAAMLVGADGRNSRVARLVGAPVYGQLGNASIAYYAYWKGFSADKLEIYFEPGRVVGAFPTHHQEALIFVQWSVSERGRFKSDVEGNYLATVRSMPAVHHRLGGARRTSRIAGLAELPNLFRQPFGPGWALVGDAGHHKDPLVARGISDAWRDSQLLADALSGSWGEEHRLKAALRHYQEIRDHASIPVARLNARLARLDEPLHELAQLWNDAAAAEAAAEELLAQALAA